MAPPRRTQCFVSIQSSYFKPSSWSCVSARKHHFIPDIPCLQLILHLAFVCFLPVALGGGGHWFQRVRKRYTNLIDLESCNTVALCCSSSSKPLFCLPGQHLSMHTDQWATFFEMLETECFPACVVCPKNRYSSCASCLESNFSQDGSFLPVKAATKRWCKPNCLPQ